MSRPPGQDWRPSAGPEMARLRARLLGQARRFFETRGVLEVDVPTLSPAAVSDVNIESIEARLALDPDRRYFLHTSPEFAMKRLLAAGFPDICWIGKVFRDGECGGRHQPEFTLVEWYRRDFGLEDMWRETVDFVADVTGQFAAAPVALTYRDAFRQLAGLDPAGATVQELASAAGADADLELALGDDRDAWLDLLLTMRVAPAFDRSRLTVLYRYPASQAALSRTCPDDPSVAERFEVFAGPIELANGYVELADAGEQRARIEADQAERQRRSLTRRPVDEKLLGALAAGLPACAGVAVGLDRLLMLAAGSDDIRAVTHFPFEAQP